MHFNKHKKRDLMHPFTFRHNKTYKAPDVHISVDRPNNRISCYSSPKKTCMTCCSTPGLYFCWAVGTVITMAKPARINVNEYSLDNRSP